MREWVIGRVSESLNNLFLRFAYPQVKLIVSLVAVKWRLLHTRLAVFMAGFTTTATRSDA